MNPLSPSPSLYPHHRDSLAPLTHPGYISCGNNYSRTMLADVATPSAAGLPYFLFTTEAHYFFRSFVARPQVLTSRKAVICRLQPALSLGGRHFH